MQPRDAKPPIVPEFGEPIDTELLLGFAEVSESDLDSAEQWFDEHASPEWVGVLSDANT